MNLTDTTIYLAVEAALPAADRRAFLQEWGRLNSSQRGAHVADVLAQLDDTDAHCSEIERFITGRVNVGPLDRPGWMSVAWLAVYYTTARSPDLEEVRGLLHRASEIDVAGWVQRGKP